MTRADLEEILGVLEDIRKKEKRYCEEYVKLNPQDKKHREAIRDWKIGTLDEVTSEIIKRYKQMTA